jgi:dihydropteroate synthase
LPQGGVLATSINAVGLLLEFVDDARKTRGAVVMAVVNTTPDSFSDGGKYMASDHARARIDAMLDEGADIIDIGAESTRPGAEEVSPQEQLDRAGPAIEHAVMRGAWVSIDTTSPVVAREALRLGVRIVNDVSCLRDPELAQVTRDADADLILMHSRGSMTTMKGFSTYNENAYEDIILDVKREWSDACTRAVGLGLGPDRIWFDPGLGFHKSAAQSMELMRRLGEFNSVGAGMVLGASRKSFLGTLDGSTPENRLGSSIAAGLIGVQRGARILRVHDVKPVVQALLAQVAFESDAPGTARPPPPEMTFHA